MNIKHVWSVLCKESLINQDNNNISIHEILEELSVFISPTEKLTENFGIPMSYEIVSMWLKNKDTELAKGEIEYILIDSENKELWKNKQAIEMTKESRRHRSRMKVVGMPLTKEGYYTLQVKIKEEDEETSRLVAELPLEIKIKLGKSPVKP